MLGRDLLHGKSGLADHARSSARSEHADIVVNQTLGEVQKTRLVEDGNDCNLPLLRHLGCVMVTVEEAAAEVYLGCC